MCPLVESILFALGLIVIWLIVNNLSLYSKIKFLKQELKGISGHYPRNSCRWVNGKEGLIDKTIRLELELKKQKAIIAELCDYVYKSK